MAGPLQSLDAGGGDKDGGLDVALSNMGEAEMMSRWVARKLRKGRVTDDQRDLKYTESSRIHLKNLRRKIIGLDYGCQQ